MIIRKYQDKDCEKLVALWDLVFPDDPPHNDPRAVIAEKTAIDDLIFVAEYGNTIIASCMAGYDGHRGWLYMVASHPEFRGLGAAVKVVQMAVESLKSLNCVKINLQIRSDNERVVSFYQKLGFVTEKRISMGRLLI